MSIWQCSRTLSERVIQSLDISSAEVLNRNHFLFSTIDSKATMAEERFDGLLMSLAQQSQGIEPLLENLFSFLRRKSDFFSGADPKKIEDTVLDILRKHKSLAERDAAEKKKVAEKEAKLKQERLDKKKKEEEAKKAAAAAATASAKSGSAVSPVGKDDVLELSEDGSFDTAAAQAKLASSASSVLPTPPPTESNPSSSSSADGSNNEKDKDSDKEDEQEDKTPPPPGNGGSTDKYVWTQTLSEVTVTVKLPEGTKSKMLDVDMRNTKLKVALKGQSSAIIDGEFHKRIVVDDSCWTIVDGEFVLTLTKDNRMEWWKCVIIGDPEINTQKVQPENSKLGELDPETRQTVEKMMFDQRQKAMGLPSSEEMQKQEMMKKFMAAHPEMDFSQAKFN